MYPRVFDGKEDGEVKSDMLGKRTVGNERGTSGLANDKSTNRRIMWKMHEVYNRVFEQKEEKKEKWTFCEECFRFCRNCERIKECRDRHEAWDSEVLRRTYDLKDTGDMRKLLMAVKREQAGKDEVEETLPLMGQRGSKKMAIYREKEVHSKKEESPGTTRRGTDHGEE